jgi:glycosyltransferase involved in cell wall biosynthesis
MEFQRRDPGTGRALSSPPHLDLPAGRLRVAVDARQVFRANRRGIGKTLVNLYARLAAVRPDWRFTLLHQQAAAVPQFAGLGNLGSARLDFRGLGRLDLWEQAVLPVSALAARADVLHAPANTGPRRSGVPVVVQVHDLIPHEEDPDSPETRDWLARVRRSVAAARHVLTVSEYSKARIVEVLNVKPEKVTVNHWAPDLGVRRVTDPAELDAVRVRLGLAPGERFAFGFGAADPRKNTAGLVGAYARLPKALRDEVRLLLVGIQDEALPRFRELADRLGVTGRVLFQGYMNEADQSAVLSAAELLAFPSRNEGFGLPILDAFVCGTPVLTGNRTSLPEVAGDAAVLVDPDDADDMTAGLERLLTDEPLRRELCARGRARAAAFTWDRTAVTAADVFQKVAEGAI